METSDLENQIYNLHGDLVNMLENETDLDEYKQTSDRLKYAESIFEKRSINNRVFKNTAWIDDDLDYVTSNTNSCNKR